MARSKAPAFQFYPADYLADENVALMTLEEEGAYIRAMCHCWREGSIPADPEKLSRLLKNCSNQTRTTVQVCFNQMATDSTRLVHPRLEAERAKQQAWADKSRKAGIESGKARRNKKLQNEPLFANGSSLVEPKGNSSSSSSSSSIKTKTKSVVPLPLPEWIPLEAWESFVEMRRGMKAPFTTKARNLTLQTLDKLRTAGNDPAAVLNKSVQHGWAGIFEISKQNGTGYLRPPQMKFTKAGDWLNA